MPWAQAALFKLRFPREDTVEITDTAPNHNGLEAQPPHALPLPLAKRQACQGWTPGIWEARAGEAVFTIYMPETKTTHEKQTRNLGKPRPPRPPTPTAGLPWTPLCARGQSDGPRTERKQVLVSKPHTADGTHRHPSSKYYAQGAMRKLMASKLAPVRY